MVDLLATKVEAEKERGIALRIAAELGVAVASVEAVCRLLEEGGTVPFIARYRKEATGNLDEVQIRDIEDKRRYYQELEDRRDAILKAIEAAGKLTDDLRKRILAAETKSALEDLYLPYKAKRRTRATKAREMGLAPLAEVMWAGGDAAAEAERFVDAEKGVADAAAAMAGARDICAERFAEDAAVREALRERLWDEGVLHAYASREAEKSEKRTKFEDYYDFRGKIQSLKSHQILAIRRGEKEGALRSAMEVAEGAAEALMQVCFGRNIASLEALADACRDGFERLLMPSLETEVRIALKQRADREAVEVFATNLRALLLAAPLGGKAVIGIDPGLRTGCKCVVLDARGAYIEGTTIFPHTGKETEARRILSGLIARHRPYAVAVGNGTAGRETEQFASKVVSGLSDGPLVVSVSESGASIYSASDVAREEFPDLDLTVRGAISIGRRLQDPLAELVKIDPKSIGVGQYQHDVFQPLLKRKLEEVIESCVNHVGVELNTASRHLLEHVAGIGTRVAERIVDFRAQVGGFSSRAQLLEVSGLGPKTYEQCAGFLRVKNGEHPLDGSAVHPERYEVVERIASDMGVALASMVGNAELVAGIERSRYVDGSLGELTLNDILSELRKPGRDPRDAFESVRFDESVREIEDLREGQKLAGIVTNVTHFGAFVDVGVHQDGLVHISELADQFVSDPSTVVKVGDRVEVWVLEVDVERRRIGLSRRGPRSEKASSDSRDSESSRRRKPSGMRATKTQGNRSHKRRPRDDRQSQSGEDLTHNPFAKLKR